MNNILMRSILVLVVGCCLSGTAWAIGGVNTSFFMKGLYHPMMIPAHLIALFSLGLLLGQQGWQTQRVVIPPFALVIASALIMTRYQVAPWNAELVLLPVAAITGVLVILKLNLTAWICLIIAVIAAAVIGMDSTVPRIPGLQPAKIYAHLTGSGLFATGLLVIISGIALALRNLLDGVILRILGAWSTAGAVLVVTLLMVAEITP